MIKSILVSLLTVATAVVTHAQTTPDVHVKLVLADNKTTFRIGEPIRLFMEFTADTAGYEVEVLSDRQQPTSDLISVSPESGVFRWLEEMYRGLRYPRDYFSTQKLSTSPVRVELVLNHTIRFDRPGKYKISITTRRVSNERSRAAKPPIELTTNEIAIELRPMSEEEEVAEIKRVSSIIDTKRDLQTDENVTRELAFLTGDASTREKVRRFLAPDNRGGNYGANIWYGIYIARNRQLALDLLENELRDLHQPVNPSHLNLATSLRFLLNSQWVPDEKVGNGILMPASNPQVLEIQNRYLSELALSLNKRSGESLRRTAFTILTTTRKDAENRSASIAEARRVLIQKFALLSVFGKEQLLRVYWDDMRDPALVEPLKQMLTDNSPLSKGLHGLAAERLVELSRDEARPHYIAQICDPTALLDIEAMSRWKEKSLPEVDSCLLTQLRRLKNPADDYARTWLQNKAALAALFATENIYQDVLTIYRETATSLPYEIAGGLLAYLAKQNEAATIPLIEETLARVKPTEEFNFLPKLTALYYSEAIGNLLKKRLELNEPESAGIAAYLLGKYGTAEDAAVLEARLDRWRKEWRDRLTDAEATQQGWLENEIITALVRGERWQLSAERKRELQQSCLTKMCKQNNPF